MRKLASSTGILAPLVRYLQARRALVPFVATTGYVVANGLRASHAVGGGGWLVGGLALAIAVAAASPSLPGNGVADDGRRRVGLLAYAMELTSIVAASMAGPSSDALFRLYGLAAAVLSSIIGARALGQIVVGPGIAASLPRTDRGRTIVTVGLLGLVGGAGCALALHAAMDPSSNPTTLPDVQRLSVGGALVILGGSAWEAARAKRLILGAGDRALAAASSVSAAGAMALAAFLLAPDAGDRIATFLLALASVAATTIASAGDAVAIARLGRRGGTLLLFGGPLVLLGALSAEGPGRSVGAVLVTGAVSLAVGSVIGHLEGPLRRADGHLLDAVRAAEEALMRADPESSITDALASLRTFAGLSNHSPELWSIAPPRVLTVDGAGYARERRAEVPALLVDVARDEPLATVRSDLLDALVVRRPDLRALARWMDEHGALSATLVLRQSEVEGVLVLPRGARRVPMSLEEARAVKQLADAFAGATLSRAALERSLERERLASRRADEATAALGARQRVDRRVEEHDRRVTSALAERSPSGPYAPEARIAVEAIERAVRRGSPVVILAPSGTDVVAQLARSHLGGPRPASPFVVVDGTSAPDHEASRWTDPVTSPLSLANHGLLLVEDADRLPRTIQAIVADALSQRLAPWEDGAEPIDVALVVTVRDAAAASEGHAGWEPKLEAFLADGLGHVVRWPHLRDRGEDLRSLVLSGLAREGLRLLGTPLGIDDAAYERLANHDFPGEEAELRSIVLQLSLARARRGGDGGQVVRLEDIATVPALNRTA